MYVISPCPSWLKWTLGWNGSPQVMQSRNVGWPNFVLHSQGGQHAVQASRKINRWLNNVPSLPRPSSAHTFHFNMFPVNVIICFACGLQHVSFPQTWCRRTFGRPSLLCPVHYCVNHACSFSKMGSTTCLKHFLFYKQYTLHIFLFFFIFFLFLVILHIWIMLNSDSQYTDILI